MMAAKKKTKYMALGKEMGSLMLKARMSPRELADRTGGTIENIEAMMKGTRKPEMWVINLLGEQARKLGNMK